MQACEDHPRLCGEKFKIAFVLFALSGSPPPMRGKALISHMLRFIMRITPAYAGKSLAEFGKISKAWDHPRLCGEKTFLNFSVADFPGSPPPMRGKGILKPPTSIFFGITPAYAGKSLPLDCLQTNLCGSPPPMRGKGKFDLSNYKCYRITPAYAGKRTPP